MDIRKGKLTFPWQKERLQTKYLKLPTNRLQAASGRWQFANTSFSDFSESSSAFLRDQEGVSSLLSAPHFSWSPKPGGSISKEHACFSRQMIRKQLRREYVNSLEEKLKQHPLVTYPHYRDHMTPELFHQVVSVLDPQMCSSTLPVPTAEEEGQDNSVEPRNEDGDGGNKDTSDFQIPDFPDPSSRNPYVLQMKACSIQKGQGRIRTGKEPEDFPGKGSPLQMKRPRDCPSTRRWTPPSPSCAEN